MFMLLFPTSISLLTYDIVYEVKEWKKSHKKISSEQHDSRNDENTKKMLLNPQKLFSFCHTQDGICVQSNSTHRTVTEM